MLTRPVIHLLLHVLVPAAVARFAYRSGRWRVFGILMATMAVDLDHLLADPIYDPGRCSIGYHPLHSFAAILIYGVLTAFPQTQVAGIGLLIHMALDLVDCAWMQM